MVSLKEIQEFLKKLKTNKEKLNYLNKILKEIDNKKLKKYIEKLIEDIKELENVIQIETRGRVDWSIPEEEPRERRTLERQVAFVPLPEEEKKEEKKIEYGLQRNVELYSGRKVDEAGIRYEGVDRRIIIDEPKSLIDENIIESRVNKQYLGKDSTKSHEDIMNDNLMEMRRYEGLREESRGYASLSEEIHEKERKKIKR